jgi:hypothetical protein
MKTATLIGILALATAGVAACGDDETGDAATSGTTTTTASAGGAGGEGGEGGAGGGTTSSSSAGGAGGGQGGAGGGQGGAGGAGLLPFGSECTENAQCESNLCHDFNADGPHCTIPCPPNPDDCPGGFGCNGMDVCKID